MFAGTYRYWTFWLGMNIGIFMLRSSGCREKESQPRAGSQGPAVPALPYPPWNYEDPKNSIPKLVFWGFTEWPR